MQHDFMINQLSAGYGAKTIIHDLTIPPLARGQIVALLGPNGCGKSTLLRALAGLNRSKGEIILNEMDITKQSFSERAKHVVYLPQTLPAGVHLRVLESIIVAQRASGGLVADEHAVMALLEKLSIGHLAMHFLDQLSGGQKQLVGLAQSLIRHPSLLLLDEPLSALDLNYQFHVMDVIRQETQARNLLTIIVVHDINIALHHADHVIMLKEGHLVATGEPDNVITSDNIAKVYGVKARVEYCSQGTRHVLIDGLMTNTAVPTAIL